MVKGKILKIFKKKTMKHHPTTSTTKKQTEMASHRVEVSENSETFLQDRKGIEKV